jgi:hypothetical protein
MLGRKMIHYALLLLLTGTAFAQDAVPFKYGKYLIDMTLTKAYSFSNGGDKFIGNIDILRSLENLSVIITENTLEILDSGISKGKANYKALSSDDSRTAIETIEIESGKKKVSLIVKKNNSIGLVSGELVTVWFKKTDD